MKKLNLFIISLVCLSIFVANTQTALLKTEAGAIFSGTNTIPTNEPKIECPYPKMPVLSHGKYKCRIIHV